MLLRLSTNTMMRVCVLTCSFTQTKCTYYMPIRNNIWISCYHFYNLEIIGKFRIDHFSRIHTIINGWCFDLDRAKKLQLSNVRFIFRVRKSFQILYTRVDLFDLFPHWRDLVYWILLCSQIFARSQILLTIWRFFVCWCAN